MFPPRLIPLFAAFALILHGPAPAAAKHVFILAGQSNMAGRGGVSDGTWDGVVPPECRPDSSIQRMSAALRWEAAREPLHADIDVNKTCGVGPGMPFAHAIRPSPNGSVAAPVVGLVPCAVGGTTMDQWEKGTRLYDQMVRRARAAAAGARAGGVAIRALLWYQGESDAASRVGAASYKAKMERLICDLRADLGLPELLVIQVLLASGEGPFVDVVREEQEEVRLPNVACVDARGLELQPDHLHLTTPAQVKLGEMLAAAYLQHSEGIHRRPVREQHF